MNLEKNNLTARQGPLMDYNEWLHYGIGEGWISPPYCDTHDTGWEWLSPSTQEAYDNGEDPCVVVLQVLEKDDDV